MLTIIVIKENITSKKEDFSVKLEGFLLVELRQSFYLFLPSICLKPFRKIRDFPAFFLLSNNSHEISRSLINLFCYLLSFIAMHRTMTKSVRKKMHRSAYGEINRKSNEHLSYRNCIVYRNKFEARKICYDKINFAVFKSTC